MIRVISPMPAKSEVLPNLLKSALAESEMFGEDRFNMKPIYNVLGSAGNGKDWVVKQLKELLKHFNEIEEQEDDDNKTKLMLEFNKKITTLNSILKQTVAAKRLREYLFIFDIYDRPTPRMQSDDESQSMFDTDKGRLLTEITALQCFLETLKQDRGLRLTFKMKEDFKLKLEKILEPSNDPEHKQKLREFFFNEMSISEEENVGHPLDVSLSLDFALNMLRLLPPNMFKNRDSLSEMVSLDDVIYLNCMDVKKAVIDELEPLCQVVSSMITTHTEMQVVELKPLFNKKIQAFKRKLTTLKAGESVLKHLHELN